MDLDSNLLIRSDRYRLPPLLVPAVSVAFGALTGWLWPDRRLWAACLAIVCCALGWIVYRKIRLRNRPDRITHADWLVPVILCALFLFAAGRQVLLIQTGFSACDQYADGIHIVEGRIVRVEPFADDTWGQADIKLNSGGIFRLYGKTAHLLPGQGVRLTARFSRPSGVRNPGGFDEARSLASQGVFLKAELLLDRIQVTDPNFRKVTVASAQMRSWIAQAARHGLPERQAALLLGILIGETRWMSSEDKRLFQEAGLSHLTAVSGANVAFILIPFVFFLRKVIGSRWLRSALTMLFLVVFGFLTSWEPSVTRALLMMGLMMAGRLVMRRSDPLNALLFAGTVMLIVKPLLIVSSSFHLSFLATGGILLFSGPLSQWLLLRAPMMPKSMLSLVSVNLAVQIMVLPIQAALSCQLIPFSLLANLPAMPLAEGATLLGAALLVPAGLGAAFGFMLPDWFLTVVFAPARLLLSALTDLAAVFADPRWPRLLTGPHTWLIAGAFSLLMIVCLTAGRHRILVIKGVLVVLIAFILLCTTDILTRPDLEVILLDVGQGDATLIRSKDGRTILIDAGTEVIGERVVKPALTALGIGQIDLLVLTHGHQDHAGGVIGLINAGKVKRLAVPQPTWRLATEQKTDGADGLETDVMAQVLDLAQKKRIPVQQLKKGDTMPINRKSNLSVLAPAEITLAARLTAAAGSRGANAFSLVLRLEAAGNSMLLTGDCDRETEQALLGDPDLDCDILRVAHHGSNATTSQPFLSGTTPALSVISVGPNDYGHPASALLERLSASQVPVLRTDQSGAIMIRIEGRRWTAHTWLQTQVRR